MKGLGAWVLCLATTLASSAAAESGGRPRSSLEFYVAPSVAELKPGEVPENASLSAELSAARGESEGFFVVLRGAKVATGRISAAPIELRGDELVLDSSRVQIWRAAWVDVDGRRVPDALLPLDGSPDIIGAAAPSPGEDVALYVEVFVPRSARAGAYKGTLKIDTADGATEVPLQVNVLSLEMPRRASLRTAFEFSGRDAALGSGGSIEGEAFTTLVQQYAMTALHNRITLVGGPDLAPRFSSLPGEGMELDFTGFDAEMKALLDGSDAVDGAAQSAITLRVPSTLKGLDRLKYVLAFQQHLEKRGWADRLVAFDDHPVMQDRLVPESLTARRGELCSLRDCVSGRVGGKRWWQVDASREGPSLALGARPSHVRAIAWLAFGGGATGLRYGNALEGFGPALYNGAVPTGALFYPVRTAQKGAPRVVESLRLKLLRDGLEDYELLRLAREAGHASVANEWLTRVAGAADRISADAAEWGRARQALADAAMNPIRIDKAPKAKPKRKPVDDLPPVPVDRACIESSDGTTTACPKLR